MSATLPVGFAQSFQPGEMIPEQDYARFNRFVNRPSGESDDAYAARLSAAGLAVVITSADAHDIPRFRELVAEANARGVPVAMRTAPIPMPGFDPDAHEAAKTAALDAARKRA